MNERFTEELLSGYVDGELSLSERRAVEAELAAQEASRQLLADFQHLRAELTALPTVRLPADFADRVTQAALAARQRQLATLARRKTAALAGGLAMALAACGLWMFLSPRQEAAPSPLAPRPPVPVVQASASPVNSLLEVIRAAWPSENETVVLRLKVPDDKAAAEALQTTFAQFGVGREGVTPAGVDSAALSGAYRAELATRLRIAADDRAAWDAATTLPAGAYYVQATLSDLEKLFTQLLSGAAGGWSLLPEARLPQLAHSADAGRASETTTAKAMVQALDATLFRLQRQGSARSDVIKVAPSAKPEAGLRQVLLLIEPAENR